MRSNCAVQCVERTPPEEDVEYGDMYKCYLYWLMEENTRQQHTSCRWVQFSLDPVQIGLGC